MIDKKFINPMAAQVVDIIGAMRVADVGTRAGDEGATGESRRVVSTSARAASFGGHRRDPAASGGGCCASGSAVAATSDGRAAPVSPGAAGVPVGGCADCFPGGETRSCAPL